MNEEQLLKFQNRADSIGAWLDENCPYVFTDQKHLEENTVERSYWHYGYRAALEDVIHKLRADG